jgi:hypothetical protein
MRQVLDNNNQHRATLLASTGYGNTGSSAVTNILEEFGPVKSLGNTEFTFAHETDGIADLESSFIEGHRLKTDLAVKRFLKLAHTLALSEQYSFSFRGKFEYYAKEYIKTIVKCKWNGGWHRSDETEKYSLLTKFRVRLAARFYWYYLQSKPYELFEPDGWYPQYTPLSDEYYSNFLSPEEHLDFLKKTRLFTDNLINEENTSNAYRYILLDQAIPSISFSRYIKYFSFPKLIIVDRDPRDLYVMAKAIWGSGYIPTQSVEQFIDWYSATRFSRDRELADNNDVLFVTFESLIYEYDTSLRKIANYIGMTERDHSLKLQRFNPELSIKNTQVFLYYPQLSNDIKKIECKLEKFCYNFPEKNDKKNERFFLIEELNNKANSIKECGKIPNKYKKYLPCILFDLTILSINFKRIKQRKGIPFLKSLIKILFGLFSLPFELFIYTFLYVFTGKKTNS